MNHFYEENGYRPYIAGSAGNNGASSQNFDDHVLHKDGTITLTKQTDDPFHRYYNEDGELIYQTNWTEADIERYIKNSKHERPYKTWLDNVTFLLRSMGNDDLNGRAIEGMFARAKAVGWDPLRLTLMRVYSQEAKTQDGIDFVGSFVDVREAAEGKVPVSGPIKKGFEWITGVPAENFWHWVYRKMGEGTSPTTRMGRPSDKVYPNTNRSKDF